jgi:glycosyltransferase involved in cell wall biosynthesis
LRKANSGAASARNFGIDHCGGDLIAFLDADDYWEPNKLELQLDVLRRHPEVGLVFGRYFKQRPGQIREPWTPRSDRTGFGDVPVDRVLQARGMETFRIGLRAWTSTVAIRREALGGHRFDGQFEPAEDRDLWIRVVADRPSFMLSEPIATAVLEPGSMSRSNIDKDFGNMLRVIRRNGGIVGKRDARRWESRFFRLWAACHLGEGCPREALVPAWNRWVRQPASMEGWWTLLKCLALAAKEAGRPILSDPLGAGKRPSIQLDPPSTPGALS